MEAAAPIVRGKQRERQMEVRQMQIESKFYKKFYKIGVGGVS
jgi:hypothetical protein